MLFRFSSTLKIDNVSVHFDNLKGDSVKLTDLEGNEAKCSQCLLPLKDGDDVIVIQNTNVKDGEIELNREVYIVHMNSHGHSCLEDFISRMITSYASMNIPEEPAEPPIAMNDNQSNPPELPDNLSPSV